MRPMRGCTGVLVLALPAVSLAAAPQIGYAQATGYFKRDTRPTLYQPLNLLDGREATAWCSPTADPLSEQITFGFKEPAKIDEVRVYTGNGFDDSTWKDFAKAKKFSLKGPTGGTKFTVNGTFEGLKSNATMAHIHQGTAPGVRGPKLLDLTVTKSLSGTLSGSFDLTPDQIESLKKGKWYVQIHSEKAPEGNLWGWLLP